MGGGDNGSLHCPVGWAPPPSPYANQDHSPHLAAIQLGPALGTEQAVHDTTNPACPEKRRKVFRASNVCNKCRSLKHKCDEEKPRCGNCVEKDWECGYGETVVSKQDMLHHMLTATNDNITAMTANIAAMTANIATMTAKITTMNENIIQLNQQARQARQL
jgi:hypothetical protein